MIKHFLRALTFQRSISGKVAKVLAALRRLKTICPQEILVSIYKPLILPHRDYCSDDWGNGVAGQRLEKLKNRAAARMMTETG